MGYRRPLCQVDNVESDSITITMIGELDAAREWELLNLVLTLEPIANTTVVLDMSEVTFVDSRGLSSILKVQAYLEGRRCALQLRRPQRQLLRLLELVEAMNLLTIIDDASRIHPDEQESSTI